MPDSMPRARRMIVLFWFVFSLAALACICSGGVSDVFDDTLSELDDIGEADNVESVEIEDVIGFDQDFVIEGDDYCSGLLVEEVASALGFSGGELEARVFEGTAIEQTQYNCTYRNFEGDEEDVRYALTVTVFTNVLDTEQRYLVDTGLKDDEEGYRQLTGPWNEAIYYFQNDTHSFNMKQGFLVAGAGIKEFNGDGEQAVIELSTLWASRLPGAESAGAAEAPGDANVIVGRDYCSGLSVEEVSSALGYTGGDLSESDTGVSVTCIYDGFDGTSSDQFFQLQVIDDSEGEAQQRYEDETFSAPDNPGFREVSGTWDQGVSDLGFGGDQPRMRFQVGTYYVIMWSNSGTPDQQDAVIELAMLFAGRLTGDAAPAAGGNAGTDTTTGGGGTDPGDSGPPPSLSGSPDTALEFFNNSQAGAICGIYIAPEGTDTWGGNWITDGSMISRGQSYVIDEFVSGTYDLKVQDCSGNLPAWSLGVSIPASSAPVGIDINDPVAAANFTNDTGEDICGVYLIRSTQFAERGWTRNLLNDNATIPAGDDRFFELSNELWDFRFDLCGGGSIESQNNLVNLAVEFNLSEL